MKKHAANIARELAKESLRIYATRRMLWVGVLFLAAALLPTSAAKVLRPETGPSPWQVPPLDWTTVGAILAPPVFASLVVGQLPPPDARQRKPPCETRVAQEAIEGYCWQRLPVYPCPAGLAFEYEKACYVPVLKAASAPTTGGTLPVTVAGEP